MDVVFLRPAVVFQRREVRLESFPLQFRRAAFARIRPVDHRHAARVSGASAGVARVVNACGNPSGWEKNLWPEKPSACSGRLRQNHFFNSRS